MITANKNKNKNGKKILKENRYLHCNTQHKFRMCRIFMQGLAWCNNNRNTT